MSQSEPNKITTEAKEPPLTKPQKNAQMALMPAVNAAVVISSYQDNIAGKDVDLLALVDGLSDCFDTAQKGDLSNLEAMLIGQATALQTIFTSLARGAQAQKDQKKLASLLSLALKAQGQSRATIQAVIDLKYPRQVAFVQQANISHGPQQVNNGPPDHATTAHAHAEENQSAPNRLLEDKGHERTHLDAGAASTTSRSDPPLATVDAVQRAKKRRG